MSLYTKSVALAAPVQLVGDVDMRPCARQPERILTRSASPVGWRRRYKNGRFNLFEWVLAAPVQLVGDVDLQPGLYHTLWLQLAAPVQLVGDVDT